MEPSTCLDLVSLLLGVVEALTWGHIISLLLSLESSEHRSWITKCPHELHKVGLSVMRVIEFVVELQDEVLPRAPEPLGWSTPLVPGRM
jgi:hypothetical protein